MRSTPRCGSARIRDWLPHGSAKLGHAELQPIWLTAIDEAPNGGNYLFLTDGAERARDWRRSTGCSICSTGVTRRPLAGARTRWRSARAAGHEVTYWQQGERGWEKKA